MDIRLKRNILLDGSLHYENEVVTTSDVNAKKLISADFAESVNSKAENDTELDELIDKIPAQSKKTTGKK